MNARKWSCCLLVSMLAGRSLQAEIPAPEKLLPADTLAALVVPDWDKARAAYANSAVGQFWQDAALKPFKDKLIKKVQDDLVAPIERELGIKFEDYLGLFRGQMTVAVTQNGWDRKSAQEPAWLFLLDTKDAKPGVGKILGDLRKKWVDSGKKIKTQKIRDLEFVSLIVDREEIKKSLEKVFPPKPKEAGETQESKTEPPPPLELLLGQADGLLIMGNSKNEIEKLLSRKTGGLAAPLSDSAAFQANRAIALKDALSYLWVNAAVITDVLSRPAPESEKNDQAPPEFTAEKLIGALGLKAVKSVVAAYQQGKDGPMANLYFSVPEASRKGLFKMLIPEAKDASPPPFVPADAIKFTRCRIDGKKFWAGLETMLGEMAPQINGMLEMALSVAGKDKDPSFDLKKTLLGNLGNDFISYQKAPRSPKLADLASPPSLLLVGSSNPEQLARATRVAATLLPEPLNTVKEREFLGRKIYSMALPPPPGQPGNATGPRNMSFVVNAGYLAFSADPALIEEFLRSSDTKAKALRETAGLTEAAEKVGGMNSGLFVFEDQAETMRWTLEALKQDPNGLTKGLSLPLLNKPAEGDKDKDKGMADWFDYKLLPPYEKIARYFHFTVCSASASADGLGLKVFFPLSPALKK